MRAVLPFILLATSQTFAMGHSDLASERNYILCERRLTDTAAEQREKVLDEEFLGRPFVIWTVHDMTNEGMRKMGIDPNYSERALKDLVLIVERSPDRRHLIVKLNRYANYGFKTIQEFEFNEPILSDYKSLKIPDTHMNLPHAQLETQYPEPARAFWVGYKSENDPDGVRRYLTFGKRKSGGEVTSTITFGLDVPPALKTAAKYSSDLVEVTDDLRTPDGNWRRIGVLSFARVD